MRDGAELTCRPSRAHARTGEAGSGSGGARWRTGESSGAWSRRRDLWACVVPSEGTFGGHPMPAVRRQAEGVIFVVAHGTRHLAFNWKAFHKTIYANGEGSNSVLLSFDAELLLRKCAGQS